MVGLILDIILFCIIVIAFIVGLRWGFIKTAVRLLGNILAIFIAGLLGGSVAAWLFRSFFKEPFAQRVNEMLTTAATGLGAESVLNQLPDFLVRALEERGVTADTLMLGADQAGTVDRIVGAAEPVMVGILKVLTVIVIFMIVMVIARVLADLFGRRAHPAMADVLSSVLGGVLNLLSALLMIWIVFSVFNVFLPMTSEEIQGLVESYIQQSVLIKTLYAYNPIQVLIG